VSIEQRRRVPEPGSWTDDTLNACQRELYDRSAQPPILLPGGLYKSTDGGKTWKAIHAFHFASCVAVSPLDSEVLYVGTNDHPFHDDCRAQGVLMTVNGGKTWRQQVNGLTCWNICWLCIDPRDPSRLYVGTGCNGAFGGIRAFSRREEPPALRGQ